MNRGLDLYRIDTEAPQPMQAPEYWFPMEAMVLENVLLYDPEEAIDVLVMTRRERRKCGRNLDGRSPGGVRGGSPFGFCRWSEMP